MNYAYCIMCNRISWVRCSIQTEWIRVDNARIHAKRHDSKKWLIITF